MPGKHHLPKASPKSERMYEHIKTSEVKSGASTADAKRIAASTTNKARAASGEAKTTHGKPNPKHK